MGSVHPIRTDRAERLLCEWRLIAERALYVCETSQDVSRHAEVYRAYLSAREEYRAANDDDSEVA
jgi:hypothetical protein